MICGLSGKVLEISRNLLTLDVHGVGYEVICSKSLLNKVSDGQEATLVIYTEAREDSLKLFGFEDRLEKQVFLLLIKVKGVGTRSALEIISRIDKRELLRVIAAGDVLRLQSVKGIGRKTAERIVVELRDKVADYAMEEEALGQRAEKQLAEPLRDALQAMVSLGFSRREAEAALAKAQGPGGLDGRDAGDLVKEALKFV